MEWRERILEDIPPQVSVSPIWIRDSISISDILDIPKANEFPGNPAPPQLTMPDFSQSQGGFSQGAFASDLPIYLAVIEEFNECGVSHWFFTSWNFADILILLPFPISLLSEATSASLSTLWSIMLLLQLNLVEYGTLDHCATLFNIIILKWTLCYTVLYHGL